jgi:predicted ATPase
MRRAQHNLPAEVSSFVGRENELVEAQRRLAGTRLLSLTGAGGVGKTRIALRLAARVLHEYSDGPWLVELAPLVDPGLVPHVVAAVLGVRDVGVRHLAQTLSDELNARGQVLLVLDNCEHLVQACAELVDQLLRACPALQILATSRERLGITGEAVWRVPSLAMPDPDRLPPLKELANYEAVRLFVERAEAVETSFRLTAANAATVATICRRLDGIPLALELAAARTRMLAIDEVAARTADRLRLLTTGGRTAPSRQQTLRATIEWSHQLLSDEERALFRRLSVFAGGFTLEAAEAICSGAPVIADLVIDLLQQLIDKSLVNVETTESTNEARYGLLEVLRQYGLEQLRSAGEEIDVRRRHARWCIELAERAQHYYFGPHHQDWLRRLQIEYGNLRGALEWCWSQPGENASGFALTVVLGHIGAAWNIVGYTDARGWITRAREWLDLRACSPTTSQQPRDRTRVLLEEAYFHVSAGHSRSALPRLTEARLLASQQDDEAASALAEMLLGLIALGEGDGASAAGSLGTSIDRARRSGLDYLARFAAYFLASVYQQHGDGDAALTLLHEASESARQAGDQITRRMAVQGLGQLALIRGEVSLAHELLREALHISLEQQDAGGIADCLGHWLVSPRRRRTGGARRACWARRKRTARQSSSSGRGPSGPNVIGSPRFVVNGSVKPRSPTRSQQAAGCASRPPSSWRLAPPPNPSRQ